MPRGAYVGVNNVARKIRKGYVGVDGVARRIRKAYIGIGGVARPCWSGGELVYYGQLTNITIYAGAGDSTNKYAIFSGSNSYAYGVNKDLTIIKSSNTVSERYSVDATAVGDYVLFAGGTKSNGETSYNSYYSNVDAVDNSLTFINAPSLSNAKSNMTGTRIGQYAIFGGGFIQSSRGYTVYNVGEVYDAQLTKIDTSINFGYGISSASTTLGQYAISGGGGWLDSGYNITYACDLSLTNIPINSLTDNKQCLAATSVGNYALFAGGGDLAPESTIVDVYDNNLTKLMNINLSSAKQKLAATTLEDYAIFFGGIPSYYTYNDKITYDTYDSQLVHKMNTIDITLDNWKNISAANIGNYAIFAGDGSYTKNPNIFTIV